MLVALIGGLVGRLAGSYYALGFGGEGERILGRGIGTGGEAGKESGATG